MTQIAKTFLVCLLLSPQVGNALVVSWTDTYNGSDSCQDLGYGIKVDTTTGNVFAGGSECRDPSGQNLNIWIRKYTSGGLISWTTTYNTPWSEDDVINGLALDSGASVLFTGYSSTTPTTVTFTGKYNADGLLQWTTTYPTLPTPGDKWGVAQGISVDPGNNIYLAGAFSSSSGTAFNHDIWVAKYNASGLLQWTTTYDGPANGKDYAWGIASDSSGNSYVVGESSVTGQNEDLWIRKYDSNGLPQWTQIYNSAGDNIDVAYAVTLGTAGFVHVTGIRRAGLSPALFLAKYNTSGLLIWTTTYANVAGYGIAVDSQANSYVTGRTIESNPDIWVGKFDPDGFLLWSTMYDCLSTSCSGQGIALGSAGEAHVIGYFLHSGAEDHNIWVRKYSQVPAMPVGLGGVALSTTSIKWIWTDDRPENHEDRFRIVSSTGGSLSPDLAAHTTFYQRGGFAPNTLVPGFLQAFNPYGTANSATLNLYTLANPPTGFALTEVFAASATFGWSSNFNTSATEYRLERWISGGSTQTATLTGTSGALTGLSPGTTYFFAIRAVNGAGVSTAYDVTLSSVTRVQVVGSDVILPGQSTTIFLYPPTGEIKLEFPPQSFPQTVQVSLNTPSSYPAPASPNASLRATGVGIEVVLEGGLQPDREVTVTVAYRDSDAAGMDEGKLVLARYDPRGLWVPLVSQVDSLNNRVTTRTRHFSLFQLMEAQTAQGLGNIRVFPNPFRPNRGQSAVTFSNLPSGARIRVYSYLGELLRDLTANSSGMAPWDGKNESGRNVASGVYLVLVEGAGDRRTLQVAVER